MVCALSQWRGEMELLGYSVEPNMQALGLSERPYDQKEGAWLLKMNTGVDLWPTRIYTNLCTPVPAPAHS